MLDHRLVSGFIELDDDHERMLVLAAQIPIATLSERRDIIETFIHYTADHFSTEERIMLEYNYPDIDTHREIHRSMQDRMIEVLPRILRTTDDHELLNSFYLSLYNHIMIHDLELITFLKEQGISPSSLM